MTITVDGKNIECTATGFLANAEDWNEEVATAFVQTQQIELTEQHWDIIKYLREEFFNHNENQPNTRSIVKEMQKKWNDKSVSAATLYKLFSKDPSKQGGMIAGMPESRRQGGY